MWRSVDDDIVVFECLSREVVLAGATGTLNSSRRELPVVPLLVALLRSLLIIELATVRRLDARLRTSASDDEVLEPFSGLSLTEGSWEVGGERDDGRVMDSGTLNAESEIEADVLEETVLRCFEGRMEESGRDLSGATTGLRDIGGSSHDVTILGIAPRLDDVGAE